MTGLGRPQNWQHWIERDGARPPRFTLWALIAALIVHSVLLTLGFSYALDRAAKPERLIAVQLSQVDDPLPQPSEPEAELPVEPQTPESKPDSEPQPPEPTPYSQNPTPVMKIQETVASEPSNISINSEAFKTFIARESKLSSETKEQQLTDFEQSFVAPKEEPKKEFDRGTPAMGGGNYKVSRNGQTCQTLVMVPQRFDDFSDGTLSTSGLCKPNKKAFNLTNEDGSIRNSDQVD